jgi:hypothetical protein
MSKLEEIKQCMKTLHNPDQSNLYQFHPAADKVDEHKVEWIIHLLSLIEEKDKALAFYADEATYDIDHLGKHGYIIIDKDSGNIARKALRGE